MRKRKQRGFSLIELLIVVAIILIIAAIAIPNLLNARRTANEASAASSVRTILSSETQYKINTNTYGTLTQLNAAGLIDNSIGQAPNQKSGYTFTSANVAADTFSIIATPNNINSGVRSFCADQSGVILFGGNPATNPPTLGTQANCTNAMQ